MRNYIFSIIAFILFSFIFMPKPVQAHCDGLDGPVVMAAREALKTENVNLVLIWVQETDENEIRKIFNHTLVVRKLGEEARELADTFFFEILVRVHRAGEDAPYTGLKPAGRNLGPAIPAADKAVDKGSAKEVLALLTEAVHNGLHQRFVNVQKLKNFDKNDVNAGRDFVKSYVEFLHYVEPIYETAIKETAHGHTKNIEKHNH